MLPIFKNARWSFQLCFSLYIVFFFFQKGKTELAGKDPHVLTFNQNSKIKHYAKTKFPPGNLCYFRDCANKSKLSWKQFPSAGPLQSFWKDWNVPFSPLVHFPLIENLFAHPPVEVTQLENTWRKQSDKELSRLRKSHAALGKDHPAHYEWAKLAGFNSVRFFCMICTRSGLPFLIFLILPWKKLTFSAAAKSSSFLTFPLLENRFNSHALQQPQEDRAGAVAGMGISHQRYPSPSPVSTSLSGARESSHWSTGPHRLLGMAQCPQAWLKWTQARKRKPEKRL